jgi:hypothetical protein
LGTHDFQQAILKKIRALEAMRTRMLSSAINSGFPATTFILFSLVQGELCLTHPK